MSSKIIQLITKGDTKDYELIRNALHVYDDYLHSVPDLKRAVKVRVLIKELKELRNERKI